MIQIQAWQVDFHQGKSDLGLLIRMDKLKGILKLYTVSIIDLCTVGFDISLCAQQSWPALVPRP